MNTEAEGRATEVRLRAERRARDLLQVEQPRERAPRAWA